MLPPVEVRKVNDMKEVEDEQALRSYLRASGAVKDAESRVEALNSLVAKVIRALANLHRDPFPMKVKFSRKQGKIYILKYTHDDVK